jgi:hypothetical protein
MHEPCFRGFSAVLDPAFALDRVRRAGGPATELAARFRLFVLMFSAGAFFDFDPFPPFNLPKVSCPIILPTAAFNVRMLLSSSSGISAPK